MAKNLPQEELESDALVTYYARVVGFLQQNLYSVIALGVVILLMIAGGVLYFLHQQQLEEEANELLPQAEQHFEQGDYEAALYGDPEEGTIGYVELIRDYSGTTAANMASYYAAVSYMELGDNEQALEYIQRFDPPEGIMGVGPLAMHGVILSNLERYEEAAEKFIKAAEWDINEATTPQNLLRAAEAYIENDRFGEAERLVSRILNEFEDSEVTEQAERMQGMLSARM